MTEALTKVCKNCGLKKPLAAFLQLDDKHGRIYANFCLDCRKSIAAKAVASKDEDESTSSEIKFRIDSKTKVQAEIDKRAERTEKEERDYEERDKKNEGQIKKDQKATSTALGQKKLMSFLDRTPDQPSTNNSSKPVFGGEDHKAEANKINLKAPVLTYVTGTSKMSPEWEKFKRSLTGASAIAKSTLHAAAAKEKDKKPTPDLDKLEKSRNFKNK